MSDFTISQSSLLANTISQVHEYFGRFKGQGVAKNTISDFQHSNKSTEIVFTINTMAIYPLFFINIFYFSIFNVTQIENIVASSEQKRTRFSTIIQTDLKCKEFYHIQFRNGIRKGKTQKEQYEEYSNYIGTSALQGSAKY